MNKGRGRGEDGRVGSKKGYLRQEGSKRGSDSLGGIL